MSDITIRRAEAADQPALAALMLESNRHYWGAWDGAEEMTDTAAQAIVNGQSGVQAYLAMEDDKPLGFATVTLLHPAPTAAGTLFLKDLYVSQAARRRGLGSLFMQALARIAQEQGCARFDWTAETDNPRALDFYDDLGAERVEEKVYFRLSGDLLRRVADGP
ncbi:MAG: N-acetyltransferase family protein [Paracoccaceae bacterium]